MQLLYAGSQTTAIPCQETATVSVYDARYTDAFVARLYSQTGGIGQIATSLLL